MLLKIIIFYLNIGQLINIIKQIFQMSSVTIINIGLNNYIKTRFIII